MSVHFRRFAPAVETGHELHVTFVEAASEDAVFLERLHDARAGAELLANLAFALHLFPGPVDDLVRRITGDDDHAVHVPVDEIAGTDPERRRP